MQTKHVTTTRKTDKEKTRHLTLYPIDIFLKHPRNMIIENEQMLHFP